MFDASLQFCGDKHPGFSCLNELMQYLVFFRLPRLMLLPGHYAFSPSPVLDQAAVLLYRPSSLGYFMSRRHLVSPVSALRGEIIAAVTGFCKQR
jgi:hypothetical protein